MISFKKLGALRFYRNWFFAGFFLAVTVACDSNHEIQSGDELRYGDGYWAELAQNYEPFEAEPNIGAAYGEADWINVGRWGPVIEWPQIAVGAANRPDGRIMTWSAEYPNTFGSKLERNIASVYDPSTGEFIDANFNGHNMFCAGVSMLVDGEVLLAGGGQTISETSIFDGDTFSSEEKMHLSRWYPTTTTLPSGQVIASLGTKTAPWSEIWTEGQGWHLLDSVSLDFILDENKGVNFSDWYPALNVAPDGTLFHTGPMSELFSADLHSANAITRHGPRVQGEDNRLYNTTVMYDVGKMLIAGGGQNNSRNTALTIDINGPTPVVRATSSMEHERAMQNSIVLPNGEVLVIGGNTSGQQFSDSGTVLEPELWNPVTEAWRPVAPHQKPRNYHSTALLLQDATVMSMGGGLCGGCPTNHQNGELFEPPYLFDEVGGYAIRPTITGGPALALPGERIGLTGSDDISTFTMVRLVAMTHHHSTDQRFIPLQFNTSGAGQYEVDIHPNPNVVIPGYYWIFGLNQSGVPSVGHLIKIEITPENIPPTQPSGTSVAFEYYEGSWNAIPDYDKLTSIKQGFQADFSLRERESIGDYGFRFRGKLTVPESGLYKFYLASDDGSRLLIDGKIAVDHDGKHPFTNEKEGEFQFLGAGLHDIEVEYFETDGGDALLASWSGPQFAKRPVNSADLGGDTIALVVPPAFTTFTNAVDVAPSSQQPLALSYEYYEGDWTLVPDFAALTPVAEGRLANFSLAPRQVDDFYGFRYIGQIHVPENGSYTFFLKSDDGSKLYIDGELVVDNDGTHGAWQDMPGVVQLVAGTHDLTVEFFENSGQDSLAVSWQGPGFAKQFIQEGDFIITDTGTGTEVTEPEPTTGSSLDPQVSFEYFEGDWMALPAFDSLTPLAQGQQSGFSLSDSRADDFYGYRFAAYIDIADAGDYTFYLSSDDGSRLEIDGQLVVDNDGLHALIEAQGTIGLNAGKHHILVSYFERTGGDGLDVSWSGPAITRQPIPESVLSSAPTQFVPLSLVEIDQLAFEYFEGAWTNLPDFTSLTPALSGQVDTFSLVPAGDTTHFGMRYSAALQIDIAGTYTFYTSSNDGSQLLINDEIIVDNDGKHALVQEQGQVTLSAGRHDLEVRYFQSGGGKDLLVSWAGPGFTKEAIPPNVTFSPLAIVDANSATDTGNTDTGNTDTGNSNTDGGDTTGGATPSPQGELEYTYHEGQWNKLPDFETLAVVERGTSDSFSLPDPSQSDYYGIRFEGNISIENAGNYKFFVKSNDGTRLYIDGHLVVNNDGKHGVIELGGDINLDVGLHTIELQYFQSGGGEFLEVLWQAPGLAKQLIPNDVLSGPL